MSEGKGGEDRVREWLSAFRACSVGAEGVGEARIFADVSPPPPAGG